MLTGKNAIYIAKTPPRTKFTKDQEQTHFGAAIGGEPSERKP